MKYRIYSKMQQDEKNKTAEDNSSFPAPKKLIASSQSLPEFKYNPEEQSTVSPPPVSPPRAPTLEESFLVGYFTFSQSEEPVNPINSKTNNFSKKKHKNAFNIPVESQVVKETQETQSTPETSAAPSLQDTLTHAELNQALNDIEHIDQPIIAPNQFLFRSSNSFTGLSQSQLSDIREQMNNPQDDIPSQIGNKRTDAPSTGTESPTGEPCRKRRRMEKSHSCASDSSGFQWGDSNTKSTGKRENFVRMNLRKGKRGGGRSGRSGRRGVRGSSKALRLETTATELQTDNETACIADFDIEMDEFDSIIDSSNPNISDCNTENDWNALSPAEMGSKLHEILEQNFGYSSFRAGQQEAIERIISGKSTLVCIPTGSGKSLIYQFPALLIPKVVYSYLLIVYLHLTRDLLF